MIAHPSMIKRCHTVAACGARHSSPIRKTIAMTEQKQANAVSWPRRLDGPFKHVWTPLGRQPVEHLHEAGKAASALAAK